MDRAIIRGINPEDNAKVAELIRKVMIELGVPKVGTAYADKVLDTLYEIYNVPDAAYFVLESEGKILGCVGIGFWNTIGNVYANCKKCIYFQRQEQRLGWRFDMYLLG